MGPWAGTSHPPGSCVQSAGGTDGELSSYAGSLHFWLFWGVERMSLSRETVAWAFGSTPLFPPKEGGQRLSAQRTSDYNDAC